MTSWIPIACKRVDAAPEETNGGALLLGVASNVIYDDEQCANEDECGCR